MHEVVMYVPPPKKRKRKRKKKKPGRVLWNLPINEVFVTKRFIHARVSMDALKAMKKVCFQNGFTSQDFYEELAEMVMLDDPLTKRVIERIKSRKLAQTLNTKGAEGLKFTETGQVSENDRESLYHLIAHPEQGNAPPT